MSCGVTFSYWYIWEDLFQQVTPLSSRLLENPTRLQIKSDFQEN